MDQERRPYIPSWDKNRLWPPQPDKGSSQVKHPQDLEVGVWYKIHFFNESGEEEIEEFRIEKPVPDPEENLAQNLDVRTKKKPNAVDPTNDFYFRFGMYEIGLVPRIFNSYMGYRTNGTQGIIHQYVWTKNWVEDPRVTN